ncbi:MAG: tRNA (adenosine(37)-N6)-threonylcarbamoyltransferase complex ATPase subunit type 1 TsaE [Nitrospirae bacterium]|nr:tRNA (adenosine(37)-N6)-threonylcarbamoyltransferase complex ATPase subunit type 1 TsaE [Nitrospirota bacterium]
MTIRLHAADEAETLSIGRRLGTALKAGDVVCLHGDLGAGKTTITKGIASALGIPEREIASASYTIIAEHYGRMPLYHVDLYRLDEDSINDTGFDEYLAGCGVTVVEWAERAAGAMPDDKIDLSIEFAEDGGRNITIESARELWLAEAQIAELEKRHIEYKSGLLKLHDCKGVHEELRNKFK